jgi:hypothetical protein
VYWLIVFFLPWCIHLGFIYTTWLLSLYNSSNRLLSLYNSTSWLQRLYLANFIYLNSSLISTWTLTWLGPQSWTQSWLNFFLNSVFKLNQILWSFSWPRLLDLNQLKLLIFILLGLDLNRVLYLGIPLGSDSFRSPPSTQIGPFYLTWSQLYLLVELVLYKLDVPVYRKVSYLKQRSLIVLHVFVLPSLLTLVLPGRVTPYPISYPDAYPDFTRNCAIFLTQVATRNLTRVATRVVPKRVTQIFIRNCARFLTRVATRNLTRIIPDRVNPTLPERLPDRIKSYLITYPAG